jgi:hypothetical protein
VLWERKNRKVLKVRLNGGGDLDQWSMRLLLNTFLLVSPVETSTMH